MGLTTDSRRMFRRYLLGELPEAERAVLEEKYFTDQEIFEQVAQAENELIDSYVRGGLAPAERTRFERHYLAHPDRRERMRFAKTFLTKLDQAEAAPAIEGRSSAIAESWIRRLIAPAVGFRFSLGFSMALVAALLLVGGGWLLFETLQLRRQLAQNRGAQAEQVERERELQRQVADERKRADQLAAELERARDQARPVSPGAPQAGNTFPELIALVLTSDGMRGGAAGKTPTLNINPETKRVRLQFNVEANDYARYRMIIRPVGGEEIWGRQDLIPKPSPTGASFVVVIPADKFSAGDYILTLSGLSDSGEAVDVSKSFFRVRKK
jgi:anti-sigma factor RsiW